MNKLMGKTMKTNVKDEDRPIKNPEVLWSNNDEKTIIFYPEEYVAAELNPVASKIWHLCDGKHKYKAILSVLSSEFDVPFEVIQSDLIETLDKMASMKIIFINRKITQ